MGILEMLNAEKALKKYREYYWLSVSCSLACLVWFMVSIAISITYFLQKGDIFFSLLLLLVGIACPIIFYQLFRLAWIKRWIILQIPVAVVYCCLMIIPFVYFRYIYDILDILY